MRSPKRVSLEISDPSEWEETPLSGFAPLESGMRCQVCKDYYTTPMMTSCYHTFCSICIRRCLATDGKCPACRASEQEIKLRPNWAVEDIVNAFRAVRDTALQYASQAREGNAHKRKLDELEAGSQGDDGPQRRKTRSQTRNAADGVTVQSSSLGEEAYQDDGLVACPMCGQRMKEVSVYAHLDHCDGSSKVIHATEADASKALASAAALPQRPAATHERKRLPKLNYSLLKERDLKKKLIEMGIRATGPKALLEKRHTEWVSIWNANCDSSSPRSRRDVLQDLDSWERSQGTLAPAPSGPASSIMKKDFERAAWAASHHDDFETLIAKARKGTSRPNQAESPEGGFSTSDVANEGNQHRHQTEALENPNSSGERPNDDTIDPTSHESTTATARIAATSKTNSPPRQSPHFPQPTNHSTIDVLDAQTNEHQDSVEEIDDVPTPERTTLEQDSGGGIKPADAHASSPLFSPFPHRSHMFLPSSPMKPPVLDDANDSIVDVDG